MEETSRHRYVILEPRDGFLEKTIVDYHIVMKLNGCRVNAETASREPSSPDLGQSFEPVKSIDRLLRQGRGDDVDSRARGDSEFSYKTLDFRLPHHFMQKGVRMQSDFLGARHGATIFWHGFHEGVTDGSKDRIRPVYSISSPGELERRIHLPLYIANEFHGHAVRDRQPENGGSTRHAAVTLGVIGNVFGVVKNNKSVCF